MEGLTLPFFSSPAQHQLNGNLTPVKLDKILKRRSFKQVNKKSQWVRISKSNIEYFWEMERVHSLLSIHLLGGVDPGCSMQLVHDRNICKRNAFMGILK